MRYQMVLSATILITMCLLPNRVTAEQSFSKVVIAKKAILTYVVDGTIFTVTNNDAILTVFDNTGKVPDKNDI